MSETLISYGAYRLFERVKRKPLACKGTSSTGQFRYGRIKRGDDAFTFTVWFHESPSCDVCGKPWGQTNQPPGSS